MDSIFIYDRPVHGKEFISRRKDVGLVQNMVFGGESVALYGEPKSGKMSLVEQVFTTAKMTGEKFLVADVDFTTCRTTEDILTTFASALIRCCGTSAVEYGTLIKTFLEGTHFVFDQERFHSDGDVVSMNWVVDQIDMQRAFALPEKLAEFKGTRIVVLVRQFQNIRCPQESEELLLALEKVVSRANPQCPFVFTGSFLNGMKDVFETRRWFWRCVVRYRMAPVEMTEISEFIYRGFQSRGKVLEKEVIVWAADVLKGNMWYINQLFTILDSITRGYVNRDLAVDALRILVGTHASRFYYTMCSLTDFQVSLLKAILDGETRFSSSTVIDRYQLNSSANVRRLKDALMKKEVVWFDEKDEPHIEDPLMEYWLRKVYFAQK